MTVTIKGGGGDIMELSLHQCKDHVVVRGRDGDKTTWGILEMTPEGAMRVGCIGHAPGWPIDRRGRMRLE